MNNNLAEGIAISLIILSLCFGLTTCKIGSKYADKIEAQTRAVEGDDK